MSEICPERVSHAARSFLAYLGLGIVLDDENGLLRGFSLHGNRGRWAFQAAALQGRSAGVSSAYTGFISRIAPGRAKMARRKNEPGCRPYNSLAPKREVRDMRACQTSRFERQSLRFVPVAQLDRATRPFPSSAIPLLLLGLARSHHIPLFHNRRLGSPKVTDRH
jgi:hypothetical protein